MNTLKQFVLACAIPALLSACQGSYLNGFLIVEPMDANPNTQLASLDNRAKRPAKWGECEYWRVLRLTSHNDVDTAYNKLFRARVLRFQEIPMTEDTEINEHINFEWEAPIERPGLVYYMPPRWTDVRVDQFNQTGAVSFQISKNNKGSFIDIEYCGGGKHEIGFYVPQRLKKQFNNTLKRKFQLALRR